MGTDPIALHCDPKVIFKTHFPYLLHCYIHPHLHFAKVVRSWYGGAGNTKAISLISALEGKPTFCFRWLPTMPRPSFLARLPKSTAVLSTAGWQGLRCYQAKFHLLRHSRWSKFGSVFMFLTLPLTTGAADRKRSDEPVHRGSWGGREAGADHTAHNLWPHLAWGQPSF